MPSLEETSQRFTDELTPVRIAGIYLFFGFLWIFLSDSLLWLFADGSAIRLQIEAIKGALFVLLSSGLVYWLSARARRSERRATERLEQQTRELSILHRLLRHNLRNIATVISGRAEAARTAMSETNLRVIEKKADRLAVLSEKTNMLRGISGDDDNRVGQDVARAIREICEQYRRNYPDATVDVEIPDRLETMAPERLGSAISELVENAIVHGGPDPQVEVTLTVEDDEIRVTVADDGPGLPDIEQTPIQGAIEEGLAHSEGVGLWIVRLIVENARGRLSVSESHLGGAAITLAFPRVESPSPSPASAGDQ